MKTARSYILTFLAILLIVSSLAISCTAQTQAPDQMLAAGGIEIGSTADYAPATIAPASLPDAPVPQTSETKVRVVDKKFIAVMAALGGAEILRFTTHKLVLDHEFAAGAPWVTSVPPNQHLIAKYAAIYAAEVLVAYELKKPHSWLPGDKYIKKLWWIYPAAMAPIHIKNGVRSIRTQPPSCPVEECGPQ